MLVHKYWCTTIPKGDGDNFGVPTKLKSGLILTKSEVYHMYSPTSQSFRLHKHFQELTQFNM